MTKNEALAAIANTDYEPETYEEAAELFEAIYGRKPDARDGDAGTLFSRCCAAAPVHPGAD